MFRVDYDIVPIEIVIWQGVVPDLVINVFDSRKFSEAASKRETIDCSLLKGW